MPDLGILGILKQNMQSGIWVVPVQHASHAAGIDIQNSDLCADNLWHSIYHGHIQPYQHGRRPVQLNLIISHIGQTSGNQHPEVSIILKDGSRDWML